MQNNFLSAVIFHITEWGVLRGEIAICNMFLYFLPIFIPFRVSTPFSLELCLKLDNLKEPFEILLFIALEL